MGLYSVYDRVAEEFSAPAMAKNDGIAFRQFQDVLQKAPDYAKADYWLMKVADFDSSTGVVVPVDKPFRVERSIDE